METKDDSVLGALKDFWNNFFLHPEYRDMTPQQRKQAEEVELVFQVLEKKRLEEEKRKANRKGVQLKNKIKIPFQKWYSPKYWIGLLALLSIFPKNNKEEKIKNDPIIKMYNNSKGRGEK